MDSQKVEGRRIALRRIALEQLVAASTTAPKNRETPINITTNRMTTYAYHFGLELPFLYTILDLIIPPSHLDQASVNILIRNLYPAGKIDVDTVLRVVGCLGHGKGKAKHAVQGALVKWLVCVYEVVDAEGRKGLEGAYGVMFNLLDTMHLRAPLCHLLSMITLRKHVRLFRIRMLLDLSTKVGHEPALVGLLRVYQDHYPDILVGDATKGRASVFLHPDREFKRRLDTIQEANLQRSALSLPGQGTMGIIGRGSKRGKSASSKLEVRTSNALESSVTLEEISSIQALVQKLEKIELPNQLVSAMGDPALQKLLLLKSSYATLRRVDYWLDAFFRDQDPPSEYVAEVGTKRVEEMLEAIRDYVRFSKQIPPVCLLYITSQLKSWNGIKGQAVFLEILSYLPIQPFKDLYKNTLVLVENAILKDSVKSRLTVLTFYTNLLRNWTIFKYAGSYKGPLEASKTTVPLMEHANILCLAIVNNHKQPYTTGPSDHLTEPIILNYLFATTAFFDRPLQIIVLPSPILIYTLHFSQSLCTLSRLYSIIVSYKRAFEAQKQIFNTKPNFATRYSKEYFDTFNGFLRDICNCLWRDRALNYSEQSAKGCLFPQSLFDPLAAYANDLDLNLQKLFSLSNHSVISTVGAVGAAGGGAKEANLDLGKGVWSKLSSMEVDGVSQLVFTAIKGLEGESQEGH